MRTKLLLGTLASAAAMTLSANAFAGSGPDTLPIHVLTVLPDQADDQAEGLTKALRSAVRGADGWSLAESDYSLEVLALQLQCKEPPDAQCAGKIADQIKADRVIWATLKVEKGQAKGEVHLWTRGSGDNAHKVEYTANLVSGEDETLVGIAKAALKDLTGGPPRGTVKLKVPGVTGQVFLDGAALGPISNGEATFQIPAGSHKLVVKAAGYGDGEIAVDVKPLASSEVSLTLAKKSEVKVDWQLILGATSLGVAAVGAGLGFAGLGMVADANGSADFKEAKTRPEVLSTGETDLCKLIQSGTLQTQNPPFKGALSACNQGSTGEILQVVGFPMAGVFGGLGVALLATRGGGGSKAKTGLPSVLPVVGPGFVGSSMKLTF